MDTKERWAEKFRKEYYRLAQRVTYDKRIRSKKTHKERIYLIKKMSMDISQVSKLMQSRACTNLRYPKPLTTIKTSRRLARKDMQCAPTIHFGHTIVKSENAVVSYSNNSFMSWQRFIWDVFGEH
eukprot:TRINITY_DN8914_c0_g1_i1.p1 TRINITY_DN8914_c0_g1~~TRINITY_DN8914_c0_g1_i1.p1  ORF type:complete len:125 (+),score=8.75 TRINITY_DN8914_c0_g1_i1:421-795(+)